MTYSPITRSLRSTTFTLSTALVLLLACDGDVGNGGASTAPGTSTLPGVGGASGSLPPVSGTVIPGNGGASSVLPSNGGASVVQQTGTGVSSTGGVTGSGGSKATASGGSKATTQNTSATTGGTNSTGSCTDTPRSGETCAQAKDWGFCDDQWFIDGGYCKKTCNLCSSTSTGTGGVTGSGGSKSTATGGTKATATGGSKATGGSSTVTATGGSGSGGGEKVARLTNGKDGKTTRYWDCCKPSCGWAENAQKGGKQPTKTCGSDGVSSVGAATQSACSGGSATQCYSFAPWSVSDTLSYGFAATSASANSVCGKCFQLDFTGSGDNSNASALSTKTMIVQAINIGGDVGGDQFDLLIPGGGVGAFNACSNQWGASDLGAQYGGFLTKCGTSMSCVTDMCKAAFGSKPDLMAGCNWFTTWFNGANNPKIKYAEVTCPSAISSKSGM